MNDERTGPFWDAVAGTGPMPRAARTLGWEFVSYDAASGRIEVRFTAGDDFTTPTGHVLGGFLAAMLYDTVGPALLASLPPYEFIETLELGTSFLRPVRPGPLVGRGEVVHRDGALARLRGALHDHSGDVVATATAVARVVPLAAPPERT